MTSIIKGVTKYTRLRKKSLLILGIENKAVLNLNDAKRYATAQANIEYADISQKNDPINKAISIIVSIVKIIPQSKKITNLSPK